MFQNQEITMFKRQTFKRIVTNNEGYNTIFHPKL